MIALLQRVSQAAVAVDGAEVARIDAGLLVFVGVERGDGEAQAQRMTERLSGYRVFADEAGRLNRDIRAQGGAILLVPQFTLAADTAKGTRPSFATAAEPDRAQRLFEDLAGGLRERGVSVACGQFGADMRVSLVNEGPVTFNLRAAPSA